MAAITALFAGTLLGGLSYLGALDAALLRGSNQDRPAARAGWKTHSVEAAGFSIELPSDWELAKAAPAVVFEARDGKKVRATLTVARAPRNAREIQSASKKRFLRGERLLTFETTRRKAASFANVFVLAAETFKPA